MRTNMADKFKLQTNSADDQLSMAIWHNPHRASATDFGNAVRPRGNLANVETCQSVDNSKLLHCPWLQICQKMILEFSQ